MASDPSNRHSSSPSSSGIDPLLLQTLMARLQLRPSFLESNSYLSHSLDDYVLGDQDKVPGDSDDDDDDQLNAFFGDGAKHRRLLAKEEAKLEQEIIKIVHSGNAREALKANTGQSVAVGEHNICVGVHEESGGDYRVWEWHGHVMLFDEDTGYSPEYVYGNYFEKLPGKNKARKEDDEEEEEEEVSKIKGGENSGLRGLIGDPKDSVGNGGARVVHRNSLNAGSAAR